jgi:hypothetical protein
VQLLEIGSRRRRHRDDRRSGSSTHRREVRHRGGDGAKAQILEWKKFSVEVHAQHGYVGADHRLAHEGRQHGRIVTDVMFAPGDFTLTNDCGDTLNEVIFASGVFPLGDCWVNRRGHDSGSPGDRRRVATDID